VRGKETGKELDKKTGKETGKEIDKETRRQSEQVCMADQPM
jgi:hypothetical protein